MSAATSHDDVASDRTSRSAQHSFMRTPTGRRRRGGRSRTRQGRIVPCASRYERARREQCRTNGAAGQKAADTALHISATAVDTRETQEGIAPGTAAATAATPLSTVGPVFQHRNGRDLRPQRRRRLKRLLRVVGRLEDDIEAVADPSGQGEETVPWTAFLCQFLCNRSATADRSGTQDCVRGVDGRTSRFIRRASPRRRPTGPTSIACSTLSCSCRRQICRRQFSATCDPTGPRVCAARASGIKRIVFVRLLQNHYFDRHFRCWGGGGEGKDSERALSCPVSSVYTTRCLQTADTLINRPSNLSSKWGVDHIPLCQYNVCSRIQMESANYANGKAGRTCNRWCFWCRCSSCAPNGIAWNQGSSQLPKP